MIHIRNAVFETNSSSSHSLTLGSGELVKQPFSDEVLRKGILEVSTGEYGWEWMRYYRPENKIAYLLTMVTGGNLPEGSSNAVTEELHENNDLVRMLMDVVKEHTGCKMRINPSTNGYVDHESSGNGNELFASHAALKQFIFSPDSYIQTGNDNTGPSANIDTDRGSGSEPYYSSHFRTPKKGSKLIELELDQLGWNASIACSGVQIPEESPLLEDVIRQGVVKSACLFVPPESMRYLKPESFALNELYNFGLHFIKEIKIESLPNTETKNIKMSLKVALPVETMKNLKDYLSNNKRETPSL